MQSRRTSKLRSRRHVPQSGVGGVDDLLVDSLLPYYEREVRKLGPKLETYGTQIGRTTVAQLQRLSPLLVVDPNYRPPPPSPPFGPSWLPRVTEPIVGAVSTGFKREMTPYTEKLTKKLAVKTAVVTVPIVVLIFLGGVLLGRYTAKRNVP